VDDSLSRATLVCYAGAWRTSIIAADPGQDGARRNCRGLDVPPDAEPQDVHVHAEWQICQYLNEPGHYRRRGEREGVAPDSSPLCRAGKAHRPEDDEVRLGARYRVCWYFPEEMLQRVAADAAQTLIVPGG
jgi:hypothetical protein